MSNSKLIKELEEYKLELESADVTRLKSIIANIKYYISKKSALMTEYHSRLKQAQDYFGNEKTLKPLANIHWYLTQLAEKNNSNYYENIKFKYRPYSETENPIPFYAFSAGALFELLSDDLKSELVSKNLGILDFYCSIVYNLPINDDGSSIKILGEARSQIKEEMYYNIDFTVFSYGASILVKDLSPFAFIILKVAGLQVLSQLIYLIGEKQLKSADKGLKFTLKYIQSTAINDEDYTINDNRLKLTPSEFYTVNSILRDVSLDKLKYRNFVKKINIKSREIVHCNLIENLHKKQYYIDESIFKIIEQ